jgi:hypothetical protein
VFATAIAVRRRLDRARAMMAFEARQLAEREAVEVRERAATQRTASEVKARRAGLVQRRGQE